MIQDIHDKVQFALKFHLYDDVYLRKLLFDILFKTDSYLHIQEKRRKNV